MRTIPIVTGSVKISDSESVRASSASSASNALANGTSMLDIAADNDRAINNPGVAPLADLVFVEGRRGF